MWKILQRRLVNKKGAILAETIVGVAIYAIIMIAFAATLASASTLFLRAQVGAREWERVFVKMENKDYSSEVTVGSSEFNLVLTAKEMKYSEIIIAEDGEPFSETGSFSLSGVSSSILVKDQVFRRYAEPVENYATSRSDNKVYIYTIGKK